MAQFVNFVVDIYFLFDVQVARGNVTFRHVVVVVTYKKLHAVFREELSKLVAKLRSKSFVVANYQGRTIDVGNDVCHRESFTTTCNTAQYLRCQAVV